MNKPNFNFARCMAFAGMAFFLAGCATTADYAEKNVRASSGPAFSPVFFKSGKPLAGDGLLESVSNRSAAENAIRVNLEVLKNTKLVFRVEGYTDNLECEAQSCIELSERRAQLLHRYLIRQGAIPMSLREPVGKGASEAVSDNSNEEGRFYNRRATVVAAPERVNGAEAIK